MLTNSRWPVLNFMSIRNLYSMRSWSVITLVCTELILDDTKMHFAFSVTLKHSRNQVHQWVNQEGNLLATKCRFVLHTGYQWLLSTGGQLSCTLDVHMWDNHMTGRYINTLWERGKTEHLTHHHKKNPHLEKSPKAIYPFVNVWKWINNNLEI